jgi:IMP cyclohydrolase
MSLTYTHPIVHKQFQDREQKQRQEAVAMLRKENQDQFNTPTVAETKIKSVTQTMGEKKSPEKKKTKSNKPAWAMTEEIAAVR